MSRNRALTRERLAAGALMVPSPAAERGPCARGREPDAATPREARSHLRLGAVQLRRRGEEQRAKTCSERGVSARARAARRRKGAFLSTRPRRGGAPPTRAIRRTVRACRHWVRGNSARHGATAVQRESVGRTCGATRRGAKARQRTDHAAASARPCGARQQLRAPEVAGEAEAAASMGRGWRGANKWRRKLTWQEGSGGLHRRAPRSTRSIAPRSGCAAPSLRVGVSAARRVVRLEGLGHDRAAAPWPGPGRR